MDQLVKQWLGHFHRIGRRSNLQHTFCTYIDGTNQVTSQFASAAVNIVLPARAAAPRATWATATNVISGVTSDMQWRSAANATDIAAEDWATVNGTTLSSVSWQSDLRVEIRVAPTTTARASNIIGFNVRAHVASADIFEDDVLVFDYAEVVAEAPVAEEAVEESVADEAVTEEAAADEVEAEEAATEEAVADEVATEAAEEAIEEEYYVENEEEYEDVIEEEEEVLAA